VTYTGHRGPILVWDNNEEEEERQSVVTVAAKIGPQVKVFSDGVNLFWNEIFKSGRNPLQEMLQKVDTEYVAFMQDDMLFPPSSQHFWHCLLETASAVNVGLVAPCSNGLYEGQSLLRMDLPQRFAAGHVHGNACLGKTSVLLDVGGWKSEHWHAIDLDLCLRLQLHGYLVVVDRRAYVHHEPATTNKKTVPGLNERIIEWGEKGLNGLIKAYGLFPFYDKILCGTHDTNMAAVVHGWSWEAFAKELERRVPEWHPPRASDSLGLEGDLE
jgi:cellulose synthase/poly-beta-1,6-N-acetylglucosamine synthase-like glycosyltransferase